MDSTIPVTRIPAGDQKGHPAILEHLAVSIGAGFKPAWVSWQDAPADHAYIGFELPRTMATRQPKVWRCAKIAAANLSERLLNTLLGHGSWSDFEKWCVQKQAEFNDATSRRERRRQREPEGIKQMRRDIRGCTNPRDLKNIRNRLWGARRSVLWSRRIDENHRRVDHGKVISGSKKLWPLSGLLINCRWIQDTKRCAEEVKDYFSSKWNAKNNIELELWRDLRDAVNHKTVCFDTSVIRTAVQDPFQG